MADDSEEQVPICNGASEVVVGGGGGGGGGGVSGQELGRGLSAKLWYREGIKIGVRMAGADR